MLHTIYILNLERFAKRFSRLFIGQYVAHCQSYRSYSFSPLSTDNGTTPSRSSAGRFVPRRLSSCLCGNRPSRRQQPPPLRGMFGRCLTGILAILADLAGSHSVLMLAPIGRACLACASFWPMVVTSQTCVTITELNRRLCVFLSPVD
jgi:hypothetical protein